MNILFVNYGDFTTNSLNHIGGFANTLSAAGHACIVAVPRGRAEDYAVLDRLVAAGRVRPVLADVFPLERAHEAFAAQEAGREVGKVIIRVGEPEVPRPLIHRYH